MNEADEAMRAATGAVEPPIAKEAAPQPHDDTQRTPSNLSDRPALAQGRFVGAAEDNDAPLLAFETHGAGVPVVFIHGWGVDRSVLRPVAAALGGEHQVVLLDLAGHGASALPAHDLAIEDHAARVAERLASLGIVRPIVVGHSMGALVALALAARIEVRAAVLLECHLVPAPSALAPLRDVVVRLRGDAAYGAAAGLLSFLLGPAIDEDVRARVLALARKVPAPVLAASLGAALAYDSASELARVRSPILYVGTAAPYLDRARCTAIAPTIAFAEVDATSHYFPLTVPGDVAALLREFFAGVG